MKKHLLAFFAICLGALCVSESISAGEINYSYATGDTLPWGNNKLETYDVAMFIPGNALNGKKITKITVPCRATVATNISLWLSSKLELQTLDNVKCAAPDILQVPMENSRMLELTLDEPYEITEAGVYVGYTLTIPSGSILASDKTNPGRYPITVTSGSVENGFFIHTSRTYTTWKDVIQLGIKYTADISVVLEGDFHENSVSVENVTSCLSKINTPSETTVKFANHGTGAVNSFDYILTAGDTKTEGTVSFPTPLSPDFNKTYEKTFEVPSVASVGHYDLTFEITKVNGVENQDERSSFTSWIDVPSFYPVHRPVMEEFTALGCGYCPQGYVALKWMGEHYSDFIGISYHCDFNGVTDAMSCVPTSYWYGYSGSLPSAVLDRQHLDSPYAGNTNYHMGILYTWQEFCKEAAPCSIEVDSKWNDDKSAINITLEARFMTSHSNADYRFAYFILADSVSDPSWYQVNYCNSGQFLQYPAEFGWETFTKGASKVFNLTFDDIALASPTPTGVASSIPSDIVMDEKVEWKTTFNLSSVAKYDYLIHENGTNLKIVAAVIDGKTGQIVNGNKARIGASSASGIDAPVVDNEATVISTALYDLNGRQVNNPSNGIYIRCEKMSDGSVRTSKIAL